MANISVVSTTNSIKVDFGDYASSVGVTKGIWRKDKVRFNLRSDFIEVIAQNENGFGVVYTTSGNYLIIDTIDGVSPTSNSDLYDKLCTLIQ
jgi:hypothetical protein